MRIKLHFLPIKERESTFFVLTCNFYTEPVERQLSNTCLGLFYMVYSWICCKIMGNKKMYNFMDFRGGDWILYDFKEKTKYEKW